MRVRKYRFVAITSVVALQISGAMEIAAEPRVDGSTGIVASIDKAPVSADGDVTGRPFDFVITLDGSGDPGTEGRSLSAGRSIRVFLPAEFDLGSIDPAYPVAELPSPGICTPGNLQCTTGVLLRGWPQDPFFPPSAHHAFSIDVPANAIVYTARQDLGGIPAIKQLHMVLHGVRNPAPGAYRARVEAETGPGGAIETGEGLIRVLPTPKPSINVTSVFVKPLAAGVCGPGTLPPNPDNPIYQSTGLGADAPLVWTFLLWGQNTAPLDGVRLQRVDRDRWSLIRDGAGDGLGGLLGTVSIDAPPGASGHAVRLNNESGIACPTLLPAAPVVGGTPGIGPQPVGRLDIRFTAGDTAGVYTTRLSLRDGNIVTMVVTAE